MDIMIAGAGTVGYSLAERLSVKHNVIVVDKSIETLTNLDENIDILTLHGDIEDPKTFQHFDMQAIDLFIAVTDSDEANLLSTLIIDDNLKVKKKILRLKNDYFANSTVLDKLNIEEVVFPDLLTAEKVSALFDFPKANNVKAFSKTKHKLISIKVQCRDDVSYHVKDFMRKNMVVIGIERKKNFIIPDPEDQIEQNDLVYFFGDPHEIESFSMGIDVKMPSVIKKVAIFGANLLAQKIAMALMPKNLEIKMIDKNRQNCYEAANLLKDKVTVINPSYDDHHLFEDEGLKNADIIIAAGKNDEQNIVKCMEAKEYGIEKVVAINNDKNYYNLMHKLGIVVVRGSKTGAYYAVLEMIASNTVVRERHFCGGHAVVLMRQLDMDSPLLGQRVKLKKIDDTFICLIRENEILALDEETILQENDTIAVFGKTEQEEKIHKWINTL